MVAYPTATAAMTGCPSLTAASCRPAANDTTLTDYVLAPDVPQLACLSIASADEVNFGRCSSQAGAEAPWASTCAGLH